MIEAMLRRDRMVVITGLGFVTFSAWAWTLIGASTMISSAGGMEDMIGSVTMSVADWSSSHAALIILMWWIMMAAMMLPSAVPLVLLATSLHRRRDRHGSPALMATVLTTGYLAVWGAFSLCATLAQWGLEVSGFISRTTMGAGPVLAAVILIAAGLYQISLAKRICLTRCRSPVSFIAEHWRPGAAGALRLDLLHGGFCVGCCWFLMGLLFVGGVMNPFWIGGIALYVLLEKIAPHGTALTRASALSLVGVGIVILAGVI
jgi:predicted metal-binding membrane protein